MRALESLRRTDSGRRSAAPGEPCSEVPGTPIGDQRAGASSRRAYFRVETHLPVRLCWMTSEQAQALTHSIETSRRDELSIGDEGLRATLRRIEEKLDLLLQAQQGAVPLPLAFSEPKKVVLSGSGLATDTAEPFRPGDPVKVELLLPGSTPRSVTALARVVYGPARRVNQGQERVALDFVHIDESDRDAIVRHVYDVQRLMLRGRKRAGQQR